ncbi:MAG TPA: acetyl-CoA C-acetyltransferase [Erysipelothrix sp.]|nr:acetyl-CoA C-acetyltransferase [Erysipelothrix sp.]
MKDVVIVSAKRTAIGAFGKGFLNVPAFELGAAVIEDALKAIDLDPNLVGSIIMGNVLQSGLGQNPARQAAIKGGIPFDKPAFTVNEVCGSGMKAIHLGMQSIQLGQHDIVVVGGFENMSRAPHIVSNARFGTKFTSLETLDVIMSDGLQDAFTQLPMGITAENVADQFNITRLEQDKFALESQLRAIKALSIGVFKSEITPVFNGKEMITVDEHVRNNSSLESLGKLKPAFKEGGSVTAGNSSGINDGASALILMSAEKAQELGLKVLARIDGYSEVGNDPAIMGYAPFVAMSDLIERHNLEIQKIDRIELNEAFAAQSIAVSRDLNLDMSRVNVNGGAIALGHPLGSSGSRIVVSLIHELQRSQTHTGIASLCVGGGIGLAMLISRP